VRFPNNEPDDFSVAGNLISDLAKIGRKKSAQLRVHTLYDGGVGAWSNGAYGLGMVNL